MKAIVDPDPCVGCGLCEEVCPNVFQMTDDDKAVVTTDPVPPEDEEACKEAAEECPVEAIALET